MQEEYIFNEVTDLKMTIDFTKGSGIVDLKQGEEIRELFIIYKGLPVKENIENFLNALRDFLS